MCTRALGAFHAGDHAGFEEQRHAEDPRLRSGAHGETEEAAEDSGGCFDLKYPDLRLLVRIEFGFLISSVHATVLTLLLKTVIVFFQDIIFIVASACTTRWP